MTIRTPRPRALWRQIQDAKDAQLTPQMVIAYAARRFKTPRQTSRRAAEQRRYRARVRQWLTEPANLWCRVSELVTPGTVRNATQCHHVYGKRGRLLNWEPGWMPVSDFGQRWAHDHPQEAVALGIIGPTGTWNDPARARAHLGL